MGKYNNTFKLDNQNQQIHELNEAIKSNHDKSMHIRYTVIHQHLYGYANVDIAKMFDVCPHTVGTYIRKYNTYGLSSLVPAPRSGAPKFLTEEQEEKLTEVITQNIPDNVGFPNRKNWNASLALQWVKNNFSVQFSNSGMLKVLHRLGLSFTRPTYTLAKADPKNQEEFKISFEGLKKLLDGKIDHLLFQDESMIRDYQAIQRTWFIKGQQRIIPTCGKHHSVKLLGVLNYETGHVYCVEEEKYDAQIFMNFLQNILLQYPAGKVVMILDNARIHHAALIQSFIDDNKHRLELVFLPPYSPKLNLIEGLW